jgi:cytochrome c556
MTRSLLIPSMFRLSLLLATFALSAASGADTPAREAAPPADKPETELTRQMDGINGAFRKLRRQVADAGRNAESLELVATMRRHAAASVDEVPAKAANIPEADRAKWTADFKARMREMLGTIDKLEAALKAGQNEEAAKLVTELGNQQRAGHKEYRVEKKK